MSSGRPRLRSLYGPLSSKITDLTIHVHACRPTCQVLLLQIFSSPAWCGKTNHNIDQTENDMPCFARNHRNRPLNTVVFIRLPSEKKSSLKKSGRVHIVAVVSLNDFKGGIIRRGLVPPQTLECQAENCPVASPMRKGPCSARRKKLVRHCDRQARHAAARIGMHLYDPHHSARKLFPPGR
jgi:hypothetical protein